ncbi:MAG: phosphocholine cytidylyltransferase family protein [Anaerolinea sp.]|nr:phosphocholine cytidylyltransferase family protein [Anaerolinea sp.]
MIFVTGYKENMIKDFMKKTFPELNVNFITNTDYENNNNSYSLWMTREYVKGDILLLDSDILFDKRIISSLLKSENENCLAVNFTDKLDEEQIKVILNGEKEVLEIGKEISIEKSEGESIGIEKFSAYFMKALFTILDRKISAENNVNEFYEASFQELIDKGGSGNSIFAEDVSEYTCMEIDTVDDYEKAKNLKI